MMRRSRQDSFRRPSRLGGLVEKLKTRKKIISLRKRYALIIRFVARTVCGRGG
jgi:hypothetical protein